MSGLHYRFDWSIVVQHPYSDWLLTGVKVTLLLVVTTSILSLCFGTVLAVLQRSRVLALRLPADAYVGIVRNIPGLFWLLFFYFIFPELLPTSWEKGLNSYIYYPVVASIIALTVNNSAYVSDIVRTGLLAVPVGQHEAAIASGLSRSQQYLCVILPQAVRIILPPLGTRMIHNFKNTSLCMAISTPELTWATQQIESLTFRGLEVTAVATGFYCVVALLLGAVIATLENHWQPLAQRQQLWTNRIYGILG
jgi:polar amino acid transport system permease protein